MLAGSTSCSRQDTPTQIEVDRPSATADTPIRIHITGLEPGERVVVSAEAVDREDLAWRSHASFVADDDGTVDLGDAGPVDGSYGGVDAVGLLWSMEPVSGSGLAGFVPRDPEADGEFVVQLEAVPASSEPARAQIRRTWMASSVSHTTLRLDDDGVIGELYRPNGESRGGVLLVGGSDGGVRTRFQAALLASHGFSALAVGYFGLPGLPPTLHDIPIEYFATAARLLPQPVRVVGYSRGSEAALLVSALYPDLIHGAVVYAPASQVNPGFPGGGNAWTHGGTAQTVIPFASITGPVLAIAGTDDRLWPSAAAAVALKQRTGAEVRLYEGAGHNVGAPPFLPSSAGPYTHPVTGEAFNLGGTRPADARAQAESWPELLAMLAA